MSVARQHRQLRPQEEYERNQKVFSDYLARINLTIQSPADFQRLVMRSVEILEPEEPSWPGTGLGT
jgi:hypothetical protein